MLIPCPECGKELEGRKLHAHCRKSHGILYALSEETLDVIVRPANQKSAEEATQRCPICGVYKASVKELANHYALAHASDMERNFKRPNTKKKLKGRFARQSVFNNRCRSQWAIQGGAPSLGKRK